jgi:hypothetical protein
VFEFVKNERIMVEHKRKHSASCAIVGSMALLH